MDVATINLPFKGLDFYTDVKSIITYQKTCNECSNNGISQSSILGCNSKFRCAYFYAGFGGLILPSILFLSAGSYFWYKKFHYC